MRRISTVLCACLMLAACSKAVEEESSNADTGRSGPGVDVTAAPGVAFDYRYAFRLPPTRIASAQEAHAQACEKLGVTRCRITGMRYTLTRGDGVEAMLAFKLDPTLARAFGRQGIAAIEAADGMLIDAAITGTDAAAQIAGIEQADTALAEARAKIDRELARKDVPDNARAELARQRGDLDALRREAQRQTQEQRATLASTPVTFTYHSGTVVRGFGAYAVLAEAADMAGTSAQWTLAVLLGAIALLGPPALALLLALLAWRRWGEAARGWWRTTGSAGAD
ncbi:MULTISPECIES: hypothetical protein [unclassified Sphingomonas]|uniref:hypothetical protein n=1 Tax=unclassified Sphingomonas TaxID=196159 RepID=UPI000B0DE933|nr:MULTISPECIES: hypothetical protein [unclassified Sphingomonas]MBN8847532.1 hypothetical protein [Sphingomonas sp.]